MQRRKVWRVLKNMQTNTSLFFFFFFLKTLRDLLKICVCLPPTPAPSPFFFLLKFSNLHPWGPSRYQSPPMLSRACAMLSPPVEPAGTEFGGAAGTSREVFPCRTPVWVSSTGPFSGSRVAEPSSAAEIGVTLLCSGLRPFFQPQPPGPDARTTCLAEGAKNLQHNLGGWLGVLMPDLFSKWVTLDQIMRTI